MITAFLPSFTPPFLASPLYHQGVTRVVALSDGRRVVSGSEDTTVRVWDVNTGSWDNDLTFFPYLDGSTTSVFVDLDWCAVYAVGSQLYFCHKISDDIAIPPSPPLPSSSNCVLS